MNPPSAERLGDELGALDPPLSDASVRRIGWALSEHASAAFRRG